MEILKTKSINLRIIAILLSFFIAVSPFANIRKVRAEFVLSGIAVTAIVGILLTALASQGDISGDYTVTAPQLDAIQQTAQGLLVAAGAGAIDQANKLGEAIMSGAESAKIKALASGAVIYAFLQAVQDTLFSESFDKPVIAKPNSKIFYSPTYGPITVTSSILDLTVNNIFGDWAIGRWNNRNDLLAKPMSLGSKDYRVIFSMYRYRNGSSAYHFSDYQSAQKMAIMSVDSGLEALLNGPIYAEPVTKIASAPSVTIPTVLPSSVSDNINNWDGTNDLVLAPPLPYDIPTGEDLVIDPSYTGSEVEDPDTPDIPDKPEDIDMPWLSALLALLGLGNPSLDGIEAGVKTAIDTIIDGITATAQDVFDGSKEIFGNITDALTGIDATVQTGIDAITGAISVPLTGISDFVLSVPDFFAIPEGKSIATPIIEQIPQVFPIVDQMNTALNKITVETRPLIIYYPYLDGSTKQITLDWYEPAREQVKHGVGLLFKVVTALACFAMVSNVFGIGIRVGTGQAYTDNNNGGGSSGNSRKKED